ncbi:RHS repeat-associated core domain-containing protein [Sorangium sp. So ce1128]
MSTAPAPDASAPPGMCPGVAVLGGGGGSGDGGGGGSGGGDGSGGGGSGSGKSGAGDQKNAPSGQGRQRSEGEPVDVVTGRVYTVPRIDLSLPGPLPFSFVRRYSSAMAERDVGLGYGWAHSLGWRVTITRRAIRVWTDEGISVDFPVLSEGSEAIGPWGWLLRRERGGYRLDKGDGLLHVFALPLDGEREWLLTAIEDRSGNRIAIVHEGSRIAEVLDSAGRRARFASSPEGRIVSISVYNATSQGRWIPFARYEHDDLGRLVAAVDAEGFTSRYAYDERNLLTEHTDRAGLTFHYRYDGERRCVETWGDRDGRPDPGLADGLSPLLADGTTRARGIYHCRFAYLPDGYREVASSRQVKRFFGNRHGLLDLEVDGGHAVSATYDDAGHLLSETDELQAVTRYDRDARGRLLTQADPLGRVVRYERDARGDIVRVIDPAGLATTIERDASGLPVRTTDPAGAVRRFAYDPRGQLIEAEDASGRVVRIGYDAHGNVVSLLDRRGGRWQWTYDFFGRTLSMTDPTGAVSRFHYSPRGNLVATTDPAGATARYTHDGEGRLVSVADRAGRTSRIAWCGYHWLHEVTDATGRTARMRYGRDGEVLEVENARGEKHVFEYDAALRRVKERTFDGRVLRYRYDPAGQQTRVEPGIGAPVDFVYDLAGQLVAREVEGKREAYAYDVRGFLASVAGPDGTVSFERDAMGRIVRETQQAPGGPAFTVEVGHDAEGRAIGRRTSLGHTLSWEPAPDGRAARVTLDGRQVVRRHFDPLGREIARVLPGGGEVHSAFDAVGRLSRRVVRRAATGPAVGGGEPGWVGPRPAGTVVDARYSYDPTGRIEAVEDLTRGRAAYRRDPAGRLLEVLADAGLSEVFAFDPTGNLVDAGPGAPAREHGPGDRLIRRGDVAYRYDGLGRLVEKREGGARVTRYAWDGRGLLRRVETPEGRRVEFSYDAFARRIEKRVSTLDGAGARLVSRTRFYWDRHVPVHEVRTREGEAVVEERTYVFDGGSAVPLAHCETRRAGGDVASRWYHYVNDPLGTPERLLDERGDVAGELRLSAWGKRIEGSGKEGVTTPLRFLGQYADEETGLVYNRHRYYDPEVGRFISPDPIGLEGGVNLYARGVDPTAEADVYGKFVSWIEPQPISAAEKKAMRDAARARFDADPELKARQASIKERKNASQCANVAKEAKSLGAGHQTQITGPALDDHRNEPLQSWDDSTGKPKLWEDHWVNQNSDGRIVDYDQGMIFDNRQQYTTAMFENPRVSYQTDYGEW